MTRLEKLIAEQKEIHDKIFAARGDVHMSPVQALWNRMHEIDAEILGVK